MLIHISICVFAFVAAGQLPAAPAPCGWDRYRPTHITEFAAKMVKKRVVPKYPSEGVRKRLSGRVAIRILVDRQGRVVATCPVPPTSRTPTADPVLVSAAQDAARRWVFRPDFGLPPGVKLNADLVEDVLFFDFKLPAGPKGRPRATCSLANPQEKSPFP
jgi:hypothetical protein